MLIVSGTTSHEIYIDFTNSYTINEIIIDGNTEQVYKDEGYTQYWKVGIFEYDRESDWE